MADLRLPYPNGPRLTDEPFEARRKVHENLDAIADWIRSESTICRVEALDSTYEEWRAAAIAIDGFKQAVR